MDRYDLLEMKEWKILIKCHWRNKPVDPVGFEDILEKHETIYQKTFDNDDSLFDKIRKDCMKKLDTTDNWMFIYNNLNAHLDDYQMISSFSCNFIDYGIRYHGVCGLVQAMICIVDGVYHIFDMIPGETLFDWIEISFAPIDHGYYNFRSRYALESMLFDRRK